MLKLVIWDDAQQVYLYSNSELHAFPSPVAATLAVEGN